MRIVPFALCLILTAGLVFVLNSQLGEQCRHWENS